MVHALKPKANVTTFDEYATTVILPHIERELSPVKRIDVIWDTYQERSLKATARSNRGLGVRTKVTPMGKIPRNWDTFMRNSTNKKELFEFLAMHIARNIFEAKQQVISTCQEQTLFNPVVKSESSMSDLQLCNHEEFDTRVLLHARNAAKNGHRQILIRANNTDVIVLAISFFVYIRADKMWVTFGVGKTFRYIAIHDICQGMSSSKLSALLRIPCSYGM